MCESTAYRDCQQKPYRRSMTHKRKNMKKRNHPLNLKTVLTTAKDQSHNKGRGGVRPEKRGGKAQKGEGKEVDGGLSRESLKLFDFRARHTKLKRSERYFYCGARERPDVEGRQVGSKKRKKGNRPRKSKRLTPTEQDKQSAQGMGRGVGYREKEGTNLSMGRPPVAVEGKKRSGGNENFAQRNGSKQRKEDGI